MNSTELLNHINNRELLDEETVKQVKHLIEEYPYFQTAHLLYAENLYLTNNKRFEDVLAYTSALCADRRRLFYLINNKKFELFVRKSTNTENNDRTDEILDSYLTTFTKEEETEELQQLSASSIISTDYLAYINEANTNIQTENDINDNIPELKHQNIIDSFLEKAETNEITLQPFQKETNRTTKVDTEQVGGSFLTETLAKIYIKQKKYEQALIIIRQLSLNFPKKSAYFVDQIRFLEHLILNEKNKKE